MNFTLFTEGVDQIARNYLRQVRDVSDARERWQAVLDADPATLPQRDVGLAGRGWLDGLPLVLPFSTKWENTRQEAAEVMRYTDRVQL